jgi:TPR repeat protein
MRKIWTVLIGGAVLAAGAVAVAQRLDLAQRLERRAEAGNAEARYHLGMLYNNGIGVARDPRRAFAHFRAAAEAGDPLAAYKVGCYYAGQFGNAAVEPDEAQALRWKSIAARAGYSLAQLDVAVHHLRGQRWSAALPWLEAAGRQGEVQALYNLSVIHTDGLGRAPSRPHAWAYFRLSQLASRGEVNANAQRALDEIWGRMSATERSQAQRIAATFVTGPTPLTRRAMEGLERAERVASGQR